MTPRDLIALLFAVVDAVLCVGIAEARHEEHNAGMISLVHVDMAQCQTRERIRLFGW